MSARACSESPLQTETQATSVGYFWETGLQRGRRVSGDLLHRFGRASEQESWVSRDGKTGFDGGKDRCSTRQCMRPLRCCRGRCRRRRDRGSDDSERRFQLCEARLERRGRGGSELALLLLDERERLTRCVERDPLELVSIFFAGKMSFTERRVENEPAA